MATWSDLVTHVESNYKISAKKDGMLVLDFLTDEASSRSQMVFIWHTPTEGGSDWAQVESPIARLDEVDLRAAIKLVAGKVCGGLSSVQGLLTIRHGIPLANLDANEIADPIASIVDTADAMEKELTGADVW